MNRRDFLHRTGSCMAHLGLFGGLASSVSLRAFAQTVIPRYKVLTEQPNGRIERIADGVWALISTPWSKGEGAMRTFANGGIIAGRSGVMVIEGFASADGARWAAEQTRELTGRLPTHVLVTHHHGDHSSGLLGYQDLSANTIYVTTNDTRERLGSKNQRTVDALASAQLVDQGKPTVIDLGGRRVTITRRSGHTSSDLTAVVDDPSVLFAGDLLWNRFFPNYVDAIPSVLSREVRALRDAHGPIPVPGHGGIFNDEDFTNYIGVIDAVEEAARKARSAGTPAAEAAKTFTLPSSLGDWPKFSDNYFEVALKAWERERGA